MTVIFGIGLAGCDGSQRQPAPAPENPSGGNTAYVEQPPPPEPRVESASLSIAVECEAPPAVQPDPRYDEYEKRWIYPEPEPVQPFASAPRFGSGATLTRSHSSSVRFADSLRRNPDMSFDQVTRRYTFTFHFLPLDADGLIGSRLADATFDGLHVNFAPILGAYRLRYLGIRRLELRINGDVVILRENPPALDDAQTRFDVTS